ncbi:UDP-glucuronosyltransferase [Aphelenchoides besseyi]|nr:UDP-glucuronosyltransferase [Aphelenchoides besseyi]
MCITFLCTDGVERGLNYKLILLNNRDEVLDRKTSAAHWEDGYLAGRDEQAPERGTWLGITRDGRIGNLLSITEPEHHKLQLPNAPSRGSYCFGNSPRESPMKKVVYGQEVFDRLVNQQLTETSTESEIVDSLMKLARDSTEHFPDPQIAIQTCRDDSYNRCLSSIFVHFPPAVRYVYDQKIKQLFKELQIPSTDRKKSSLFGPGIYFTDCSTKAANYTSLSEQKFKGGADTGDVVPSFVTSKVGYLFAAEVSLGKTKYLTKTDSTAYLRLSIHVLMLHLVSEVMAFNILIASGTDTGSHQASMSAMFIRFAQAGHHVYIFDTSNPKPVNYGYANIQTLSAYIQPNLTERAEKITKFWRLPFRSTSPSGMHIWGDELLGKFIDDHSEVLTTIMKLKIDLVVIDEIKTHPSAIAKQFHELHGVPFIDFWTTEPYNHLNDVLNVQYDLIIADPIFSPHAFSLSMRLKNERNIPYLFYSTSGQVTVGLTEPMSLGRNPVVKAFMFPNPPRSSNDYFQPTIFRYRLASFVDTLYEIVGFHWVVSRFYMPNIARFGVVDFSWHKLFKDASVTFSDSLERLGWPVAEGTDLINTGAYCKSSEVLSGELKEFVEDPKSNGTIYVAFGTYADWSYAPEHILTAFANGLQHFPEYRIIFSFNGDLSIMPNVPFIKLKESICSKTPMIIMPLFAEQAHNAHMFLALKLGRTLNKFTTDEYDVQHEILQNPYYQQKIEKTREIMLDRPKDALDMALFYAERIVRTRAPNNRIVFQRKGMDLYWYEYLYSEFILLLISFVLLIK